MSEPVEIKYRAFLSYAHADTRWAKWLHHAIEGFPIAAEVVGTATAIGAVPKSLRPIFRDRDDFSGGQSLGDATIAALDRSAALIVLCSPVAATRPAVNEEVRLFKQRHPGRPVIPVIVDGTPPENFPPALRYALAPDGAVSTSPMTILAPDLRPEGDGKSLALAKVVAGLTGLATDDIIRRGERDQRRRLRNGLALVSIVALAMAMLAVWAEVNRREAQTNFNLAKEVADDLVFDLAQGLREVEGMRADTVARILGTARRTFDKLTIAVPGNSDLQRSRSVMLRQFGDTYRAQGNLNGALESFQAALAVSAPMSVRFPRDEDVQGDVYKSHNRIGDIHRLQGNRPLALDHYRASRIVLEQLAASWPDKSVYRREISVSLEKIGDVQRAEGRIAEALASYEECHAIRSSLATADPGNVLWQRDLSLSLERIANLRLDRGEFAQALDGFKASHAIADRLARLDPANTERQRDLTFARIKLGDVMFASGDTAAAEVEYRGVLDARTRLANSDPSNSLWQHDLAVGLAKLGDVLLARNLVPEAMADLRAAVGIGERLSSNDPSNATWLENHAVTLVKLADAQLADLDPASASRGYGNALTLFRRLAGNDADDPTWQSNIVETLARQAITHLLIETGDRSSVPDLSRLLRELDWPMTEAMATRHRELMRRLMSATRDAPRVRPPLDEAHAILQRLSTTGRLPASGAHWQSMIETALAALPP